MSSAEQQLAVGSEEDFSAPRGGTHSRERAIGSCCCVTVMPPLTMRPPAGDATSTVMQRRLSAASAPKLYAPHPAAVTAPTAMAAPANGRAPVSPTTPHVPTDCSVEMRPPAAMAPPFATAALLIIEAAVLPSETPPAVNPTAFTAARAPNAPALTAPAVVDDSAAASLTLRLTIRTAGERGMDRAAAASQPQRTGEGHSKEGPEPDASLTLLTVTSMRDARGGGQPVRESSSCTAEAERAGSMAMGDRGAAGPPGLEALATLGHCAGASEDAGPSHVTAETD